MAFTPPAKSAALVEGIPFDDATNTAIAAKKRYDQFDKSGTRDPNLCKALLQFPDHGAVFWSSKMAVDADGPAAGPGRKNGKELDPSSGQIRTSFHLTADGGFLPSEAIRYIVLPEDMIDNKKPFHPDLGLGDVAVVIYKDKTTTAICGDMGPVVKIGEGSIATHVGLKGAAPDPCRRDTPDGPCRIIHDSSIEQDVLFFVFPHSASALGSDLTTDNLNARVEALARELFGKLGAPGA
jgi:hypothetical protein